MSSTQNTHDLGGRTMKNVVRAAWALALMVGLLTPALSFAETSRPLHDGVVVDAARGVAYVISPKGGIDALDLATGNVRWTSKAAVKPLAVVDGNLVAQAVTVDSGELPVVAFDAKGAVKQQLRIELPAGVRAQVADGPSRRFRTEAFASEDGALVVTWAASESRPVQGLLDQDAAGTPDTGALSAQEPLSGAARVDLSSGRVAEVPSAKAQSLQVAARAATAGKGLDLRRQLASLDGRHVLTSERIVQSGESGAQRRYRWTLTDASGATVGTVEAPVGRANFVVAGTQLLYVAPQVARAEGNRLVEEPLRLQALDLRTGAALWSAAVVDTAFRGPFAP
jgi:hypothetical protein